MRKWVKQLISLGIISVMVTGCSTNTVEDTAQKNTSVKVEETKKEEVKKTEDTNAGTSKSKETTKTEDTNKVTSDELPFPEYRNENGEIDLKGETVKVLWNISEKTDGWIEYFEETYNGKIEIEFADWGDIESKLAASVASGDPADITYIYASWYPGHITANFLEPIDQYLPLAETLKKEDDIHYFSEEEMEYFKWRGERYVFTQEDAQVDMGIFYNKSMLDEAGLEYPYELEKRGEWTWDKMEEYAKALTVDRDGDGTVDQYGLDSSSLFTMYLTSNDTDLVHLPRELNDAPAGVNFDDPKTMNALRAYEKLILSGNLGGVFKEGTAAMSFRANSDVKPFNENFTVDGWGFCASPKGPDNTSGKNASTHSSGWGIIKGSKKPVAATVALHCMMNRPEGQYVPENPEDVVPYDGFKNQEDFDRIKAYGQNSNKEIYHTVAWTGFADQIGKKPLGTLIEEMRPILEETLLKKAGE